MRYAFFPGCKIPYYVPHYGASSRRVLQELGIELVDLEFNCCGYPMSHLYYQSSLLAAARALAMAEAQGLDVLTPCKCCFGSFKRSMHALSQEPERRRQVAEELAKEGLAFPVKSQVKHLLSVLYHDLGLPALRQRVTRPYQHLKVAVLYGCHALRPSRVTGFDHPYAPTIIDQLVEVTGAQSIAWAGKLSCCGAPLLEHNPELSLAIINRRLSECREGGADVLAIACPYSQMQAERAYAVPRPAADRELVTGAVLYPQLLGLAMGLTSEDLTLSLNTPDAGYLLSFLSGA
ncbi:MAG: CoB--CoM heterodisulfide reductase iron-sulfur subunit B family protein [Desulfarculus sp.]|nr:CoB--CoM heterodisulfide reductase iron-sulfur subunit B family protein [Desulfarculus sp.]